MTKPYIHYGWHLSYFSGKTRSYLKYKGIPFVEKAPNMYTYMVKAKKRVNATVMPFIVTPEGEWLGDTSVIIDTLEARFPEAPVIPATPVQKIAAYVLELWGDEGWMPAGMYTRWCHPENYALFEHDAGTQLLPFFPRFLQKRAAAQAAGAMRYHLRALGVVPEQNALLDRWIRDMLDHLDRHFATTPFLLGSRPSLGDFGLIGPLYAHLSRDPWSKRELIDPRRNVRAWVDRMNDPTPRSGQFVANDQIPETLTPIFRAIFREFLPLLTVTLEEAKRAMPKYRESGRPFARGLGDVEMPLGEGRFRRRALPYMLWMVQRLQEAFRGMNAGDQEKVRAWLKSLGGEPFVEMEVPPLKRIGLLVAAA
jgi:glutathione S-transferase